MVITSETPKSHSYKKDWRSSFKRTKNHLFLEIW